MHNFSGRPQWIPRPYQVSAVNALLEKRFYALFLDPGMGKTSVVFRALKQIKDFTGSCRTLVVGPKRVILNAWPGEHRAWKDFEDLKVVCFHGKHPLDMRTSDADVFLVNYDYLEKMNSVCLKQSGVTGDWGSGKYCRNMASFYNLQGLVVDELTAFKSTSSTRFRILSKNIDGFSFRWGLTGTPVANRLQDIFGQAFIIDGGAQFGRFVTKFMSEYFYQYPYKKFSFSIKENKQEELFQKIDKLGMRLSAEDYLKLPDVLENVIHVDLPRDVMKSCKELMRNLVSVFNDTAISAHQKGIAYNKCRQITGGTLYKDDGSHMILHTAKADALEDLVTELNGNPLLCFINFRCEAEWLTKRFPGSRVLYGGVSDSESSLILDDWNRGDVPVLFAHPATTAHGLNIQHGGHHICWYTLPWDEEHYEQGNRRLHRQGQKSASVTVHKLIVSGTVDTYVESCLRTKCFSQEALFTFLKENAGGEF